MNDKAQPLRAWHELPRLAQASLLLLGCAVAAVSVRLWPEWVHNPDLSHGFFMPVVFAALVWESRRGTRRFVPQNRAAFGGVLALTGCALAALFSAGLYAAAVDWSHPLVNLSISVSLMLFLGAAWLVFASDGVRYVGCNWSGFVAILLWLLCTPIPPGTYTRLTLTLQMWVTEFVLRTLHLLGIAAVRNGNIIRMAEATVGVEEACSGIRSLISCLFAAFFFSATLVQRPAARAVILLLAAPLALAMNFARSLTLTLLANRGVDISGTWHDATGFAVLGLTAAALAAVALALSRRDAITLDPAERALARSSPTAQLVTLLAALSCAAGLAFVCVANTRPSVRQDTPTPDLAALLPDSAPGWMVSEANNLYQFRDALRTEHLAQRIYRRPESDGGVTEVILYVAYWRPGQAPVSLVASHTPDACWPGSGWSVQPVAEPRVRFPLADRALPEAEYRRFTFHSFPQHVWFWHLYDGRPLAYRDPYSAAELLRLAWKYGFRDDGDQLFVRVSSNRPAAALADEPLLRAFFSRTKALGL